MKNEKVSIRDITLDYIKKRAEEEMRPDMLPEIISARDKILKKSEKGILSYFREDIETFITILEYYEKGEYTSIPFSILAMLMFTLKYILEERDMIRDSIPCKGLVDDAIIMLYTLNEVKPEIRKFNEWKRFKL